MSSVKRIVVAIALSLCLLLSGCQKGEESVNTTTDAAVLNTDAPSASAEAPIAPSESGIRARMNAPQSLSHSFTSNTGNTRINIEASVEVPDVASVNVYEVMQREIPAQNVVAFADYIIGKGAWSGDTDYGPPRERYLGGDFDGLTEEEMYIASFEETSYGDNGELSSALYSINAGLCRQNGVIRGPQILNYGQRDNLLFGYNFPMSHSRRGMDARGCTYSRDEALSLAWQAAQALAPELTEVSCGIINMDFSTEAEYDGEEAYLFCFTRNVDGIPVTYTIHEATHTYDDENGDPIHYRINCAYESLRLVVSSDGLIDGRYESPYVIGAPLQTDVQLIDFNQMLEIVESILPLKFAWLEDSYDSTEVNVDRIVFGYTRVDFKDELYRYKLVPVWDVFGTSCNYKDGGLVNDHNDDMDSLLTINAMDGTIIDRDFGH